MATGRMLLTINLRKYLVTQPRNKRAYKATRYVRDRVSHFTKTDIDNVKISMELNSLIVKQFSKKMSPVKMTVKMENGKAFAEPFMPERAAAQEAPKAAGAVKKEAATPKK